MESGVDYNNEILSGEQLEGKNLHVILEGHAIILKSPKNLDGIFGYGTHTCSLVIVEGKDGEIGMVHVHEKIGKNDLIKFLKEFSEIQKIHVVGGSEITKALVDNATNETGINNKEYIAGQYDAIIYKEGNNNKVIITDKIPGDFKKDKVNEISSHIKSRLYIIFTQSIKNREKEIPLIIEEK